MSILNKPFIDEWQNEHFHVAKTLTLLENVINQASEPDGNKQTARSAKEAYHYLLEFNNLVIALKEQRDNESK